MTSCNTGNTKSSQTSSEFDIFELTFHIPEHQSYSNSDSGFVLTNGDIVIQKIKSMITGIPYYKQYIYDIDGIRIPLDNDNENYYRLVLETDQGNIIVTNSYGKTAVYDSSWNLIDIKESLTFYSGYSLDNGKYFAINDEYMLDYEYAHGVDSVDKPVCFALYRYTEKLTDCIFSKIVQCENGFECFYLDSTLENDSIIIDITDKVLEEESTLHVSVDSATNKYICMDKENRQMFDITFDFITTPKHNTAIAYANDKVYLICPHNYYSKQA